MATVKTRRPAQGKRATAGAISLPTCASSSSHTATNFIGARAFAQIGASQSSDIVSAVAVWGEVQLDDDSGLNDVPYGKPFLNRGTTKTMRMTDTPSTTTTCNGTRRCATYNTMAYTSPSCSKPLSGTIRTGDGSTTKASYGFIGDVNAGSKLPADQRLVWLTDGGERVRINSNGNSHQKWRRVKRHTG